MDGQYSCETQIPFAPLNIVKGILPSTSVGFKMGVTCFLRNLIIEHYESKFMLLLIENSEGLGVIL
jgi:hypothetical protein